MALLIGERTARAAIVMSYLPSSDIDHPEQVAYKMLAHLAAAEGYHLRHYPTRDENLPDRKWLLDAYAECIEAVRNQRTVKR